MNMLLVEGNTIIEEEEAILQDVTRFHRALFSVSRQKHGGTSSMM